MGRTTHSAQYDGKEREDSQNQCMSASNNSFFSNEASDDGQTRVTIARTQACKFIVLAFPSSAPTPKMDERLARHRRTEPPPEFLLLEQMSLHVVVGITTFQRISCLNSVQVTCGRSY